MAQQNKLAEDIYKMMKTDSEAAVSRLIEESATITNIANLRIQELEQQVDNATKENQRMVAEMSEMSKTKTMSCTTRIHDFTKKSTNFNRKVPK